MKKVIKAIIESNETLSGKIFNWLIQILIIVSLISFSIETLPDISPIFQDILNKSEIIIVIIFSIEYLLRIWTCDNRIKYIFSFYGIIDLLAILPFYISPGSVRQSV